MDPVKRRLGDRRARARFEIVGQLWGSLETVYPLELRNLGRGGALLESGVALRPDSVHRLRFAVADEVAEIQARVRHVTPFPGAGGDRFLIGLEFLGVPPALRSHLDRIVADELRGRERAADSPS